MATPILNKPYTPSHATDVRSTFELERARLAKEADDHAAEDFGMALGVALIRLSRHLTWTLDAGTTR